MSSILEQDIKFMPGVGPKRAEVLGNELGIFTMKDMLYHFPFRYEDRSKFYSIREVHAELPYLQIKGKFKGFSEVGNAKAKRLVAKFEDGTGSLELVWFQGIKWIKENIKPGIEYVVYGKPTSYNRIINIVHPEIEEAEKFEASLSSGVLAVYSTTEKLKKNFFNSRAIQKLQQLILKASYKTIEETLPLKIMDRMRFLSLKEALLNVHFPQSNDLLEKARFRLKFEELFYIQLNMLKLKIERNIMSTGFVFSQVGHYFNTFYDQNLPFPLTGAQKKVIKEIRRDFLSGKQMNRLLQGDVGSGKTLVALMTMLIALDNNFQACLMAPTEILANQHLVSFVELCHGMGINVKLLTGSTKKAERKVIHEQLLSGELHFLIGTHALIEDVVQFKNLGLVIIDEQHRFGVAQRARLWEKNINPPHVLVMTATPIPRTLAMTVYGDLEISVIDELPPGRKPIQTVHFFDTKRLRMFGFLKEQIKLGRQVYVVYPLIRESEKLDFKDLEDGYESISRAFPSPEYAVSIVHGQMKPKEKEIAMNYFIQGHTHIMVATTVIEVGVNVPNASVMVIESAERFGLSQLHQLRGRVGRGADQSYCILMSSHKLTHEGRKRMDTMVRTNDGFEIAEVDLKLRGPGDIEGTQQSGVPFDLKIANLGQDSQILQLARDAANAILDEDPALEKPENNILKRQLNLLNRNKINWSVIS